MFINPKIAIEQGWVIGITNLDVQLQPNAIDFTLDKLQQLMTYSPASLSETGKTMRQHVELLHPTGQWNLSCGTVYDGTSQLYCNLPEGVAAMLFTRSTLTRNGVLLTSGLYDSGYQGHVGFTLYPLSGDIHIAPGTRVGQIAFVSAVSAKLYAGGWNHDPDSHYADPK